MTLRGYYRQAAQAQRASDRVQRYYTALNTTTARRATRVRTIEDLREIKRRHARILRILTLNRDLLLIAQVAREEARARMYFDRWEYARQQKREEFIRRNWS